MAADKHDVSLRLRDTGCDRSNTHLGHQLHMNSGGRVRIFEVVNQLLEIFNRVDVVVWRRTNKPNTWC